jgi:hypothetical protein
MVAASLSGESVRIRPTATQRSGHLQEREIRRSHRPIPALHLWAVAGRTEAFGKHGSAQSPVHPAGLRHHSATAQAEFQMRIPHNQRAPGEAKKAPIPSADQQPRRWSSRYPNPRHAPVHFARRPPRPGLAHLRAFGREKTRQLDFTPSHRLAGRATVPRFHPLVASFPKGARRLETAAELHLWTARQRLPPTLACPARPRANHQRLILDCHHGPLPKPQLSSNPFVKISP